MLSNTLLLCSLSALAAAKTIQVEVGSGGLKFNPESVTADAGDQIQFNINAPHSVVSAKFTGPCVPSGDDAAFSGPDAKSFTVDVKGTDPQWYYCPVGQHCASGMVFAVNPTQDKTLDAFKQAASQAGAGKAPAQAQGGSTSSMSGMNGTASATGSGSGSGYGGSGSGASPTQSSGSGSSSGSSSSTPTSSSGAAAGSVAQGNMEYVLLGLSGVLAAVGLL